jgi:hypothetical protein
MVKSIIYNFPTPRSLFNFNLCVHIKSILRVETSNQLRVDCTAPQSGLLQVTLTIIVLSTMQIHTHYFL